MGILLFKKILVLNYNYIANLLCFKLNYQFFGMIDMIFDMIGAMDECQHGDAIPVSQQIAVCWILWNTS